MQSDFDCQITQVVTSSTTHFCTQAEEIKTSSLCTDNDRANLLPDRRVDVF